MKVLLIYDDRTRNQYRNTLVSIVHDTGGRLIEVDMSPSGTYNIVDEFERGVQNADVILVDITVPNTNIGYEIGRFLRTRDNRLIIFYFQQEDRFDIPFYLLHDKCFPINNIAGSKENINLLNQIKAVADRTALGQIEKYNFRPVDDLEAKELHLICDYVYKSPGAAFLFGEFAVTVGHPALHLPLPRYVYVGINELKSGQNTIIRYVKEQNSSLTELSKIKNEDLANIDATLSYLESCPLDITVWSQVPTMCGLGTSSAIASCIAYHLLKKKFDIDNELKKMKYVTNLLQKGTNLEKLFKLAWKIDAAFHSYLGSGAGVCASLIGTSGVNPILFFSESRQIWSGDSGRFPWELGSSRISKVEIKKAHKRIDEINCFAFSLPTTEKAFKKGHFALVYSGHRKSTGLAMKNVRNLGRYFLDKPIFIQQIVEAISAPDVILKYPLSQRRSHAYQKILKLSIDESVPLESAKKEHLGALEETLLAAYGCSALCGINSYWSNGDYSFLSLMDACQSILQVLGVTDIVNSEGETSYEIIHLINSIRSIHDSDGKKIFGAKITGGGTGGDIIIASSISNKDKFETLIRDAIHRANLYFDSKYKDFGKVHFSSTWIDGFPDNYLVSPVQQLCR